MSSSQLDSRLEKRRPAERSGMKASALGRPSRRRPPASGQSACEVRRLRQVEPGHPELPVPAGLMWRERMLLSRIGLPSSLIETLARLGRPTSRPYSVASPFHSRMRGIRRVGPLVRTLPETLLGSGRRPWSETNWLAGGMMEDWKLRDFTDRKGGFRPRSSKIFASAE